MIEILTNFDDTPLEKIETLEFDIKNYNIMSSSKKNGGFTNEEKKGDSVRNGSAHGNGACWNSDAGLRKK